MNNAIWYKGPPPKEGWWVASINGQTTSVVRYWNGTQWSFPVTPGVGVAYSLAQKEKLSGFTTKQMFWLPLSGVPDPTEGVEH